MITLLSLIASGLINVLPLFFKLFDSWMNVKKEIRIRELDIDLAKTNIAAKKDLAEIAAQLREGESLRTHDSALDSKGFIGGLRASVRPVITYSFFLLFLVVKSVTIYHLVIVGNVPFVEALPLIWDENTQAIFGAIVGFWFGGRAIEKYGTKFKG